MKNKKDEYLLIDGYNIIFAQDNLKKIANYSLEEARNKLIHILSNYQGIKGNNIIIVFDAHFVKSSKRNIEKIGNVFVIYTKEAETADNYIEYITKKYVKKNTVRVATSDNTERIIILGSGAIAISAAELKKEINKTEKYIAKKIEDIKPIKDSMLFDNIDPEIAKWIESIIKKK